MHLRRIAELLFDRRRCPRLDELAEARARIRKTPGRQLDLELVERLPRLFHQTVFHNSLPCIISRNTLRLRRARTLLHFGVRRLRRQHLRVVSYALGCHAAEIRAA